MKVIRLEDSWYLEPEDLVDRIFLEEAMYEETEWRDKLICTVVGMGRDPETMQLIHVQVKIKE